MDIFVVDTVRLALETRHAEAARTHLAHVRKTLQQGLNQLVAIHGGAADPAVRRDVARGHAMLERQFAVEKEAAEALLNDALRRAVERWREKHDAALVLPRNMVLAADATCDVTEEIFPVLEALDIVWPELPEVRVHADAETGPQAPEHPA